MSVQLMTYAELIDGWDASVPENYIKVLVSDVPTALHPLIPYAQVFGITDDGYRYDLLVKTPRTLALHVRKAVLAHETALDTWLLEVEANKSFTEAAHVFTALLMAADSIVADPE